MGSRVRRGRPPQGPLVRAERWRTAARAGCPQAARSLLATPAAPAAAEGDAPAPPPAPVTASRSAALNVCCTKKQARGVRRCVTARHRLQRELSRLGSAAPRTIAVLIICEGRPPTPSSARWPTRRAPSACSSRSRGALLGSLRRRSPCRRGGVMRSSPISCVVSTRPPRDQRSAAAPSASVPCESPRCSGTGADRGSHGVEAARDRRSSGGRAPLEELTQVLKHLRAHDRIEAPPPSRRTRCRLRLGARARRSPSSRTAARPLAEAQPRRRLSTSSRRPRLVLAPTLVLLVSASTGDHASETAQYMIGCPLRATTAACVGVGKTQADKPRGHTRVRGARKAGTPYACSTRRTPLRPKKTRRLAAQVHATARVAEAAEVGIEVGEAALFLRDRARPRGVGAEVAAAHQEGDEGARQVLEALRGTIERLRSSTRRTWRGSRSTCRSSSSRRARR